MWYNSHRTVREYEQRLYPCTASRVGKCYCAALTTQHGFVCDEQRCLCRISVGALFVLYTRVSCPCGEHPAERSRPQAAKSRRLHCHGYVQDRWSRHGYVQDRWSCHGYAQIAECAARCAARPRSSDRSRRVVCGGSGAVKRASASVPHAVRGERSGSSDSESRGAHGDTAARRVCLT